MKIRGKSFKYKYSENPYTVFPVLRIKTADGFISDTFVQIKDEKAFGSSTGISNLANELPDWKMIVLGVIVSLILAGILTFSISKILYKRTNK